MAGETIALFVGIGTGVVSLSTAAFGVAAYLRSSARKEYASERDINHLKNSISQLAMNVEQLWRWQDEKGDAIARQLDRVETLIKKQ